MSLVFLGMFFTILVLIVAQIPLIWAKDQMRQERRKELQESGLDTDKTED